VRFVYEFDGIKTYGSYFYPAMARRFRHQGVQICSMFQYDSSTTAEWNTDWDAHYLNWLYTPGKAVSFYIGGQVFHDIPRGASLIDTGTTQQFGSCAVSFDRNISVYANGQIYCNTAPYTVWKPLSIPENPKAVISVGDSPYASYDGTGIYTLDINYSKKEAVLTVNPDADIVGDPWRPDAAKSAVVLKDRKHRFELKIAGIKLTHITDSKNNRIRVESDAFEVTPGQYLLKW
jgi:hypothetical protein